MSEMCPEIIVFAGPNGSGKSTITKMADNLRVDVVSKKKSFTFETVLSTSKNLELLKQAKAEGFFIRCIYVLTADVNINVSRVKSRKASGGHDVPKEKILSRYRKALNLLPELIETCDICHIYDNSIEPFRIFKKRKNEYFFWQNYFWDEMQIKELVKVQDGTQEEIKIMNNF